MKNSLDPTLCCGRYFLASHCELKAGLKNTWNWSCSEILVLRNIYKYTLSDFVLMATFLASCHNRPVCLLVVLGSQ